MAYSTFSSYRLAVAFGPLTKQGGVKGQREWGREGVLGVFSTQIMIKKKKEEEGEEKKPARHGGGGGGGRSLFSAGLVFFHTGAWIDRKTA